ncbi:MAG: YggS family pyridoxal phosphate-dependent enzyme [Anaerolineales bacterium]|nr:YggS family pyridoxal phosphate-dependent enzyme [Anaerolineales bacterium]
MTTLQERYEQVQDRIARAARRAGRSPADVTLVAVTKTWPAETLLAAYAAGMRHFGENRPEELAEKRPFVTTHLGPASGITWHLIGTLQSRKTRLAADHADLFHALDREKIAVRLSGHLQESARQLPVFLEVNVSGEGSKSGFDAFRWETDATQQARLRSVVETVAGLPRLRLTGLMTMAPWDAPEATIRRVFQRTHALARWLETAVSGLTLPHLSMGMTDDFEIAIEEGATHVRVGRAIFGERT